MATTPEDLAAPPATAALSDRQRVQALSICIAAAFLTLLDVSILTIALPSLEQRLHMTASDVSWSLAGYTLTFGLVLVPAGRLGDEFGRRRVLLIGMVLFTLTGLLCTVAPDAVWLDAARLARGAAAGVVAPQVVGILHYMYPRRERGKAFGLYGAAVSLSTTIGPLLGGLILQALGTGVGWRWIFGAFLPVDVLVLVLAARVLPEIRRENTARRASVDLVGVLILALAVTAVMLPLVQSGGWSSRPWWLVAVGAVLLATFAAYERALAARGGKPLVDLNLFRERDYWIGILVIAALYGGFTGIFIVLAQYLQQGLHYTPLRAALSTVVFTIGSAVCGILAGRRAQRMGRKLVIGGTAATAIGLAAAAIAIRYDSGVPVPLIIAGPLLVAGCGAGCVIAANQTLALDQVPRGRGSTAAGVYQTGMKIGTSFGTAMAGSLYFSVLASRLASAAQTSRAGTAAGGVGSAPGRHLPVGSGSGAGTGAGAASAGVSAGSGAGTGSALHAASGGAMSSATTMAAEAGLLGAAALAAVAFLFAATGLTLRRRTSPQATTMAADRGAEQPI